MCPSNKICKSIMKSITKESLNMHEKQLLECYKCMSDDNPRVKEKIRYKTDLCVRFSEIF